MLWAWHMVSYLMNIALMKISVPRLQNFGYYRHLLLEIRHPNIYSSSKPSFCVSLSYIPENSYSETWICQIFTPNVFKDLAQDIYPRCLDSDVLDILSALFEKEINKRIEHQENSSENLYLVSHCFNYPGIVTIGAPPKKSNYMSD